MYAHERLFAVLHVHHVYATLTVRNFECMYCISDMTVLGAVSVYAQCAIMQQVSPVDVQDLAVSFNRRAACCCISKQAD